MELMRGGPAARAEGHAGLPSSDSDGGDWHALARRLRERAWLLGAAGVEAQVRAGLMSRYLDDNERMFELLRGLASSGRLGTLR